MIFTKLKERSPRGAAVSGRPKISNNTSVTIAAGSAIRKFTRNLSRISTRWERVAAMVVSEIMERLSPNMPPPTTAAITTLGERLPFSATPMAMGMSAEIVPMEVPVAVPKKAAMTNMPAASREGGTRDRPRLTVASLAPISPATVAKAPASM